MLNSFEDIKLHYVKAIAVYEKELEILNKLDFKKNKDGSYNKKLLLNVNDYEAELVKMEDEDYKYKVTLKVGYNPIIYFNDIEEFKSKVEKAIKDITFNLNENKTLLEKLPTTYKKVKEMLSAIDDYVKDEGYYSSYVFGI